MKKNQKKEIFTVGGVTFTIVSSHIDDGEQISIGSTLQDSYNNWEEIWEEIQIKQLKL